MWQAITGGETGREAWTVIEEIERCLLDHLKAGTEGGSGRSNPTLAGGTAGLALFFSYLDAARPGSDSGEHAVEIVGGGIDALSTWTLDPSLYSGFSGVGWVVEHLTREFFEGDDDLTCAIDEALGELLEKPPPVKSYELLRGIAGFGTYLLERLPHPGATELLVRVLDHLEATAERSPDGCTWPTRPEWMTVRQRGTFPDGCYNLGIAHGVPGVLGFLAAAKRVGVADPRISSLAEDTVRWLLSQRVPSENGSSVFPAFVSPGSDPLAARTAWCYGDLGIASVLLSASRSFGRPEWGREALDLAHLAARRSEESAGAIDAGLCHGTAGNGHLFLRLYQATGDPHLRETALHWLRRTLALRRPGSGMAGFSAWLPEETGSGGVWSAEPGFLMGAAGVGLALLAAVSDVEPAWDRVMLVSIPPRAEAESEDRRK